MSRRADRWFERLARVAGRASRGRLFNLDAVLTRPREENETVIRDLCANIPVGSDTVLCRVLGRYKMFVDAADDGHSPHLMLDGYWEMWVVEALLRLVRPGMVVADVGANLGFFTLLLAELVGEEGHVHAFEPNPPIAARLRRSVDVNGFAPRVTVHETALGDEDGRPVRMCVPARDPKNAHVVPSDRADCALEVVTRRFDGIAGLAHVDLVKIDAEGAEPEIWRGMAGLLDAGRPLTILLEFAATRYPDPGAFLDEIVAGGFALALVTIEDGVLPRTRQQILGAPARVDQMLLLQR